jgi:hypothetical protein
MLSTVNSLSLRSSESVELLQKRHPVGFSHAYSWAKVATSVRFAKLLFFVIGLCLTWQSLDMRAISDHSGGRYPLRPTEQERTRHTQRINSGLNRHRKNIESLNDHGIINLCLEYGKVPMTSLAFNFKNSANENDSVRLLLHRQDIISYQPSKHLASA